MWSPNILSVRRSNKEKRPRRLIIQRRKVVLKVFIPLSLLWLGAMLYLDSRFLQLIDMPAGLYISLAAAGTAAGLAAVIIQLKYLDERARLWLCDPPLRCKEVASLPNYTVYQRKGKASKVIPAQFTIRADRKDSSGYPTRADFISQLSRDKFKPDKSVPPDGLTEWDTVSGVDEQMPAGRYVLGCRKATDKYVYSLSLVCQAGMEQSLSMDFWDMVRGFETRS